EGPDLHAARRAPSLPGPNRQSAGGDQLASGCGGDAVHPGNARLWNVLEALHEGRAGLEQRAITAAVATGHLGDVVTRGEGWAVRAQDGDAHRGVRPDRAEARRQLAEHGERKRVAPLRAVEGDDGRRAFPFE